MDSLIRPPSRKLILVLLLAASLLCIQFAPPTPLGGREAVLMQNALLEQQLTAALRDEGDTMTLDEWSQVAAEMFGQQSKQYHIFVRLASINHSVAEVECISNAGLEATHHSSENGCKQLQVVWQEPSGEKRSQVWSHIRDGASRRNLEDNSSTCRFIIKDLLPRRRYSFQCEPSIGDSSSIISARSVLTGAVSIGRGEEALAPFAIQALLPFVDHFVYVDNNDVVAGRSSQDRTVEILHALFASEITSGRLTIASVSKQGGPLFSTSAARNCGVSILRAMGFDHFFTVDADDIVYSRRCAKSLIMLSKMAPTRTLIEWPMYFAARERGSEVLAVDDTTDFVRLLANKSGTECDTRAVHVPQFFRYRVGHARGHAILPLQGVNAEGLWIDEANGQGAEGYRFQKKYEPKEWVVPDSILLQLAADQEPLCTLSYSHTRADAALRAKMNAWHPGMKLSEFVVMKTGAHNYTNNRERRSKYVPMQHPEAVRELALDVYRFFNSSGVPCRSKTRHA